MFLLCSVAFICFDSSMRFSHIDSCVSFNWHDLVVTDYPLSIAFNTECNKIRTILSEISVQLCFNQISCPVGQVKLSSLTCRFKKSACHGQALMSVTVG